MPLVPDVVERLSDAIEGVVVAGSTLAQMGSDAGRDLVTKHLPEAGRTLARFAHDPLLRDVGRFFRNPAIKRAAKALPLVGTGITLAEEFLFEDNPDPLTSGIEAGISVVAGGVALAATTAFCLSGVGTLACLGFGAVAFVGGGAAADIVGEAVAQPISQAVGDAWEAGTEVAGDLWNAGTDLLGDVFGGLFGG